MTTSSRLSRSFIKHSENPLRINGVAEIAAESARFHVKHWFAENIVNLNWQ